MQISRQPITIKSLLSARPYRKYQAQLEVLVVQDVLQLQQVEVLQLQQLEVLQLLLHQSAISISISEMSSISNVSVLSW